MITEATTLQGYELFVTKLASPDTMRNEDTKMLTAALGLAGEAGEFADIVKKVQFHGMPFTEEVRQKLIKELSDVVWYVAFAAVHVCKLSIQEIININVAKLSDRYKSLTFSTEAFMDKERKKDLCELNIGSSISGRASEITTTLTNLAQSSLRYCSGFLPWRR